MLFLFLSYQLKNIVELGDLSQIKGSYVSLWKKGIMYYANTNAWSNVIVFA